MTDRIKVIADVLRRRPRLHRPTLAYEQRGRQVQSLAPGTTEVDWEAPAAHVAEAIDTALDAHAAAAAARAAGSAEAGHALVITYRDLDLVGVCQCGRPLGRIRPGTPLDALAVPWERHTGTPLPHTT
ncbi:hypothetical protein [Streptomyces sp. NPDC006997]|uniref:hypothetical protein n=1 Tax=Streptomyces sp. NPDC006997 TaxID=3155356 RepID=UPI003408F831